MPGPYTTGEVVMPVEVPFVADLNNPGAATGATCHIAWDTDIMAACELPRIASNIFAGFSGLTIERIGRRITIGVESSLLGLIIGPTSTSNDVGQISFVTRC